MFIDILDVSCHLGELWLNKDRHIDMQIKQIHYIHAIWMYLGQQPHQVQFFWIDSTRVANKQIVVA